MKKFDAIIIGSGQAGTPLAFKLASKGQKLAFIEKQHLGGTCLNVGCTPTKAYVASARRMWDANNGEALGIKIPDGAVADLRMIKKRKDDLIKKSVDGISDALKKNENITFYKGTAKFCGHKEVRIGDEKIRAEKIYINVGARPYIPEGFDGVPFLTNESILALEDIPQHLIIVGGSYIGLEFGQMFRRLGSRVSIVEKGNTIINREDEDVSTAILDFMKDEGIEFTLKSRCISGMKNADNSISLKVENDEKGKRKINGTHLLLAVGRRPNTDLLNPEATGLKVDYRGYIEVNDYLETNIEGIYALGDCNGKGAFTHTAYNDYEIIAENMFEGKDRKVSDRIITYGLFVDPPLGRVGLTRKEAVLKGYNILVAKREMNQILRAKEKGETTGFMSVVVDADSHKILGACVLGVGGDEIISGFINIMYANSPYEVMRDAVIPHPTVSELIPTMLEGVKSPI